MCVCPNGGVCVCRIMMMSLFLSQPQMKANLCHFRTFFKRVLVAGLQWPAVPLPPSLPSIRSFTPLPTHSPPHKRPRLPHNKLDSHRSPSICVTPGIPWTKMPLPHHPQHLCIIKAEKTACHSVGYWTKRHKEEKETGRPSAEWGGGRRGETDGERQTNDERLAF